MFDHWSPAQLAYALGYRIDLRSSGGGNRVAYFVRPSGRSHAMGHARSCKALSRLAHWRGLDPDTPPANHPRALVNGKEQS